MSTRSPFIDVLIDDVSAAELESERMPYITAMMEAGTTQQAARSRGTIGEMGMGIQSSRESRQLVHT